MPLGGFTFVFVFVFRDGAILCSSSYHGDLAGHLPLLCSAGINGMYHCAQNVLIPYNLCTGVDFPDSTVKKKENPLTCEWKRSGSHRNMGYSESVESEDLGL